LALELNGRRRTRCGGAGDLAAAVQLRKKEGDPGGAGPANGPRAESFWASVIEIKGKRFWAAKKETRSKTLELFFRLE
jgi:hypothetical protein